MQLSIVIPALNEAENLRCLVEETVAALEGVFSFEIIVVDDGSADDTVRVLEALQQRLPQLRCLSLARSVGQSTALMTGADFARGTLVATLDGDGQNDPRDLPRMVDALLHADPPLSLVMGQRTQRRDTAWRRFCSKVANGVRRCVLRDDTPDSGCGIKVFQREALLRLPRFNHMHRFFPALIRRDGGRILSMPVGHRPRRHGASHYGTLSRLAAGIVDLIGVAWLTRRSRVATIERILVSVDDQRDVVDRTGTHRAVVVHRPVPRPMAQ